ncbi:modular serine protease-like [Melitaea cinxia]|uniref:modular serine protease-like n=1 Tax=Melitaea cinxia TaxID=113334 RepID=UPI001E26ECA3|nr:modular serine protease-like [Melitaea cinxia]
MKYVSLIPLSGLNARLRSLDILLNLPFSVILHGGKCVLPPHPDNGAYTVSGNGSAVPGEVYLYVYLYVTCDPGFIPEKESVYCFEGFWSDPMPQCVRFCHLKKHPSIQYQCLTPGTGQGSRVCGSIEPNGTIVKPVCRSPDYYYPGILDYMTCDGIKWNYVAKCTLVTECGKITPPDLLLVVGGDTAYKGELPWHVGIYKKTNSYEQICGGSLVSTTTVISAAHCFWSDRTKLLPASLFAVAAGKIYRQWNDSRDSDAQKSDVLDIKVSPYFQGAGTNYQDDIAIVVVATPFQFRASVRPVCVDFDEVFNAEQLNGTALGKVGGWGLVGKNGQPSEVLKAVDLPYVSVDECFRLTPRSFEEYITSDKMCAGYTNGTALCQGDSGGGLAFPATRRGVRRYYLRGVVSTAPKNADLCSVNSLTAFTAVIKHETFVRKYINGNIAKSPTKFKTNFLELTISNHAVGFLVPLRLREFSKAVATLLANEWKCWDGTCISMARKCDSIIDCHDGSDETDPECSDDQSKLQKGFCSLKEDESVEYKCKSGTVKCGPKVASGTIVTPECRRPNYYSPSTLKNMLCVDGSWDYIAKCAPECGKITPQGVALVADGRYAKRGELPWHAAIYTKTTRPYMQICGGSLVSKNTVISAAHCFWSGTEISSPSDYAVAVGKIYRPWDNALDLDAQKSDVTAIKFPDHFLGIDTHFQSDIAVITVATPFIYKPFVRPICLDFEYNFHKSQLKENNLGKISGWGVTDKNGKISTILKVVEVPIVDTISCIVKLPQSFRQYITNDKFCAGYENGTAVCRGDSGAGLAFPALDRGETRYYLRGVLSVAPRDENDCNVNTVALYTDIILHEFFIKPNLN